MPDVTIDCLFYKNRFGCSTWQVIFLLLYSPIGIVLAGIRMCMILQAYVAASLLRSHISVRSVILRVVCCALGIVIKEDEEECKRDQSGRLLLSNHLSIFDFIPLHLLTNCETLVPSTAPKWLLRSIGLKSIPVKLTNSSDDARLTILRTQLKEHKEPVLIFPENEITSGKVGLLKFCSWWASEVDSVQPVALYLRRPAVLDVKPSVLGSTWYSDYFWSFFVPYTVYTVKYLPIVQKGENENNEAFSERIRVILAEELGIEKTNFTRADKIEYEKRFLKDKNRTRILNQGSMIMKNHCELQKMVNQVAEVFPNVSRDVIFGDLGVTGDVDVTITNILEGKIPKKGDCESSIPIPGTSFSTQSGAKIPFNKLAEQISFQERKSKLIENARRKYKEKHNIP